MASPKTIAAYGKKLDEMFASGIITPPETRIDGRRNNGKNGGWRPNIGPVPRKKMFAEKFNAILEKSVASRMKEMVDAQMDAAIGTKSEKYNAKDNSYYYVDNAPSTQAFNALTDRALGKPKEKIEHVGNIGILHLISSLNKSDEIHSIGIEEE